MENISYNLNFKKLCKMLSLGSFSNEPKQIFGGLLHLMFQLQTEKGRYAVKALNPQIMQREPAMGNYVFSEKVVKIASNSGINALPAIVVNGNSIHEVDGQYYLVFQWFDGKALAPNRVDINKCKIIGGLLAKIHNLDFSSIEYTNEDNYSVEPTDWNMYLKKARLQNLDWVSYLQENPDTLYQIEERANQAVQKNSINMVISHRDLDPKNVLWDKEDIPMIIDWEAAGAINPSLELMEVALYWAGDDTPDKEAFHAVIDSYHENGGTISGNVEDILYSVFKGKLEWLEYNMKRSLRIECSNDEDQRLGTSEVVSTIQSIYKYSKLIPVLLEWFD